MTKNQRLLFVCTLIDATCTFSDDRRCIESKNRRTPALRIYNAQGSSALTKDVGFTNAIQIFTVPYSFLEVVLVDCAHFQETF